MSFLSTTTDEQHKVAFQQFREIAVWKQGMRARVPVTALLDAAGSG